MRPDTGSGWKRENKRQKRRDNCTEKKDAGPFRSDGSVFLCQEWEILKKVLNSIFWEMIWK